MTHADRDLRQPAHHGRRIWRYLVGAVIALFGLPILAGGIWLAVLGGSWYYVAAGAGLLLTAWFLFTRNIAAVWLYLLVWLGTLLWALWEAGMNGWAQVPRLVAPTVVLLLVLTTIPALRGPRRRVVVLASVGAMALGGALLAGLPGRLVTPLAAQEAPATETETETDTAQAPAPETDTDTTPAPEADPATTAPAETALADAGTDWPAYGGTHAGRRYSTLDQITPANVGTLTRLWEFRTGDMPEGDQRFSNQNTPLKIGDQLLICSAMNKIIALDAATGLERWRFDPEVADEAIPYNATCRGLAYYADPDAFADDACAERVIMNTLDARLIAVDILTGQPCADFGTGGTVDLEEGIGHTVPGWYAPTSPPTIVRNVAVVHSQVRDNQRRDAPSGVVRGYDTVTGDLLWAWDMGRPGETGAPPEGETYTRGTPNVWTISTADEELGLVYLPLGNSAVDYWGATRSEEENTYSTALVALDVTTGQVAWSYQTVHYDVWDYDLGAQGSLIDLPTDDGVVPALVLPTKQAMFWVFDRRTGELLVEVEERPVPIGGVEPENLSPTQPFVMDFPNVLKPTLTERDMWGMTPLDQLWCRIQFRRANYEGIYTPPSADRFWVQYPGYNGGSDWGGVAIDPVRRIMVANYNDMPNHNRLVPREEADELGVSPLDELDPGETNPEGFSPQADTPWAIEVNAGWRVPFTGLLCKEPPYGGITAVDLDTRTVLWDQPFGQARRNGPFGIPSYLPFTIGTPNNGGSAVTASGLIFIAAATDNLIRAMDIATGEVLWQDVLPAGGQASPAIFEAGGRQILVINAGGHSFMETPIGDYFIAYALPD
jgi:quinoprotein glucose dehydrogenase